MLQAQALPTTTPPPAPLLDAPALTPATGPVVRSVEIRFKGEATVDRERILSNMRLKAGEIYTSEKEADDIRALYRTGDLLDVQFSAVEVAGGVKIVVTVEARASLGAVEFSGNTVFSSARLRQEVELKIGGSVDDASLAKAKDAILEVYKAKGFPDVTVDYAVTKGPTGFSQAVFTINEGGRGIIKDVIFEGATSFSSGKLRSVIKSDNRNWIKFWDLKRRVERTKIEADIKAIEEFYQNAGYLDAKVFSVEPQRVDDKHVNLVYRITEGPVYTVSTVGVAGNRLYQTSDLIPVFQLEAGQTFSLADMKIDLATIADYYGSRGYADAKVTPRIDKKAGQLDIVYAIEEGNQFKVGKISISGNQKTKEEVVRRELTIAPTEEYNTIKIRKSQARLRALDYFEEGGIDFMPVSSELGPDHKDINIDLKEKPTGQVQFGAGFSSIDNLVGFVEVTQKNFDITNWPSFTGAGQRFRLGLKAGTRRKDFIMSLTEPYFMGQRLSLGGDLFYTEKTYLSDDYDQRDMGGSINLRKPLGDNTDLRLTYTLQQVEIYDIDKDASDEIKLEEGEFLQSRLGAAWVFDNRDSFQMPTKGHKVSVEGNLSGSFLGGDVDTVSLSLSGQKYWKLPYEMIFSVQGELASVDTTGDGERVPIFERQFLGGANNLRGFEFRDVGPKDINGEPLGGNTLGWLSAEVTFPIIAKIRGAVFADAGFVNADSWDYSFGDYNADVGLGVRVNLPVVGPVKIDYGIPVTTDEFNDEGGQFQFSVDYKF